MRMLSREDVESTAGRGMAEDAGKEVGQWLGHEYNELYYYLTTGYRVAA